MKDNSSDKYQISMLHNKILNNISSLEKSVFSKLDDMRGAVNKKQDPQFEKGLKKGLIKQFPKAKIKEQNSFDEVIQKIKKFVNDLSLKALDQGTSWAIWNSENSLQKKKLILFGIEFNFIEAAFGNAWQTYAPDIEKISDEEDKVIAKYDLATLQYKYLKNHGEISLPENYEKLENIKTFLKDVSNSKDLIEVKKEKANKYINEIELEFAKKNFQDVDTNQSAFNDVENLQTSEQQDLGGENSENCALKEMSNSFC